jgi:hypothetical protein
VSSEEQRALEDCFGAGVREENEGNLRLIILPSVTTPTGCAPRELMAIYVACEFQGYRSRLFLEQPVKLRNGLQPATTTTVLLKRAMHAASIQDIPATLPPHQAIAAHLARYAGTEWK